MARAQGISPILLGRWQRATLEQAVPGSAEREEIKSATSPHASSRRALPSLVIHADRGSQYTSHACRQRVEDAGALASYARPGNPYDNAQAEVP